MNRAEYTSRRVSQTLALAERRSFLQLALRERPETLPSETESAGFETCGLRSSRQNAAASATGTSQISIPAHVEVGSPPEQSL